MIQAKKQGTALPMQRFKGQLGGINATELAEEKVPSWQEEEVHRTTRLDFFDQQEREDNIPEWPTNKPFPSSPSSASSGSSSLSSPLVPPSNDSLVSRILSLFSSTSSGNPSSYQNKALNYLHTWFGTNPKNGTKIKFFLQLLLLIWLFLSLARKFQYTDNDDARFQHLRNTECQENGVHIYSKRGKDFEKDSDLCVLPNQYKKFVWIFVDSLAFDQAEDLRAMFPDHRNVHKIMNHGFKFSTAIYTTFFTGKIPTNYAGHEIMSDNLFYQMKRADMRLKFIGPAFPTLHLLGSGGEQYFSEKLSVVSEGTPFEFLRSNADEFLSAIAKEGSSVLFTTNVIDDRIHRTGKHDLRTKELISDIRITLKKVKQFIDKNPDYLFILNADHGGSPTGGVHEGQLHGEPSNGNEAWIMFYSPSLTTLTTQGSWLDTVDVCGTISKYFYGVNIPLESIGKAAASTDNIIHKYKILKSNTLQLKQLVDLKNFPYDKTAFQQSISETNPALAVDKMEQFLLSVKLPLIDFKRFPTSELFIIGFFIVINQVSLVISECGDSSILQYVKTYPFSIFLSGLYLYLDFLFLKFDYFKTFKGIFPFYTILFGILFYHQMVSSLISSIGNTEHSSTTSALPTTSYDGTSSLGPGTRRTLLSCTIRTSAALCILWGFKLYWTHIRLITSLPFLEFFGYVALIGAVLIDFQQHSRINSVAGLSDYIQKSGFNKEALYIIIIVLIYLYETSEIIFFMQLAYVLIFVHTGISLLYYPQSLVYPATTLLFAISNLNERIFLLIVLSPVYYLLTQTIKALPAWSVSPLPFRMVSKSLMLLIINISIDCYSSMGGQFNMDVVVEAGAVGVVNVEQYPRFSGFLMGYHKLGYFFILIAYLARILAPEKKEEPDLFNGSNNAISSVWFASYETGIYLWKYLLVKAMVLMWVFHLSFWLYKDYLTCFLMTEIAALITLCFGVVLFLQVVSTSEIGNKLLMKAKMYLSKRGTILS